MATAVAVAFNRKQAENKMRIAKYLIAALILIFFLSLMVWIVNHHSVTH